MWGKVVCYLLVIWHSKVQFLKNVARPSIKETWQLRNPTLTKKHRCYTDRNRSFGVKSFLWRENKQKPSKLWLTRQYVPWLLVVVIFLCLVQNVRLRLSNTKLTLYGYNLSSRWLRKWIARWLRPLPAKYFSAIKFPPGLGVRGERCHLSQITWLI